MVWPITILSISEKRREWIKMNNAAIFDCKSVQVSCESAGKLLKYQKRMFTFKVLEYFGFEGLILQMPLDTNDIK
ncbi:MAG: hypothetical protein EZS28_005307 [Streblomastix strix]|uniref:Uncharacterized protein n=1 Tax=Streblomastix strix TaxID=222440 RepID=A0A5J4WXR7_9EUKA|nr:MAG: hypothetical protein EZS28_005307 [Streblomastix strix]